MSSTPSSSSTPRRWKYDVFLSFRGEDTRLNFVDHLYAALGQKGIVTFRDDKSLERGKSISSELLKAIEESKFALVILSPNYASSSWCLDELLKIIQCREEMGQQVMPVFYQVDPSHVWKNRGYFLQAFTEHEEVHWENRDKVRKWRAALTGVANLSGWDLRNMHEAKAIRSIVKDILNKSQYSSTSVYKGMVGMDVRLDDLLRNHIRPHFDDVRMIGIHGMRGIGKTAIARALYDQLRQDFDSSCEPSNVREVFSRGGIYPSQYEISDCFDRCCFLSNVREMSKKDGLVSLQEKLLSRVLRATIRNIEDGYAGANMIQRRLGKLRVLVVIDDVDQVAQLECLAGNHDWFGPGSRIIITSADVHLLNCVDTLYEAAVLTHDEALQLLSLKAFKKNPPPEDYLELCNNILGYAHGLPLALVVIGPFLRGRLINEWKSAIDRLRNKPETSIIDVLQISFDGLRETEKEIFLHVACFYVGKDRVRVSEILDYCQLYPDIGLSVLADKSLITISNNKLSMHALLQEMGWEIVRRESPKPGKRSRLWSHEDIHNMLKKNEATEAVQGMVMDLPKLEVANWNPKAFSKLSELNFLQIRNVDLPNGLTYLSNSLRLLEWSGYPLRSLPQNFEADELIELNLCHSKIEHLWEGTKCFDKLKFIKLCHSQNIFQTPDLTGACSLECLDLEGCKNLVKIHPSVGVLKKLIVLNLKDCGSLESLLDRIEMESLKTLILSGCSNIKKIPEFGRNMECLSELYLDRTGIEKLPDSIQHLSGLSFLDLSNCKNLFCLPSTINRLTSLQNINLSGCQKLGGPDKSARELDFLPANVATITPVTELPSSVFSISDLVKDSSSHGCEVVHESSFEFLPSGLMQTVYEEPMSFRLSLSGLGNLTDLNISDCNLDDRAFLNNFGWLPCLVALNLSGNDFVKLPPNIRWLDKLENVNLENCKRLEDLSNLPSNSKLDVRADGCSSLRILFDISNYNRLEESYFSFINCFKLNEDRGRSNIAFEMLKIVLHQAISTTKETFQIVFPGSEIPRWFKHQRRKDSLGVCILPPRPYSSRFMGFALCAVFVINDERHQVDELEIHHFKTFKATHNLVCYLKLNGKELEVCGRQPAFRFSEEFCQVESDHRWVFYVSSDKYFGIEEHDRCSQIELLFEARGPGLKVKACGLRLIFEQDVHELMKECRHTQAYGRHGYVRRYECDCWVDGYLYSI